MKRRIACALLAMPLWAAYAQVISVEVRDSVTRQPVVGAVVKLLRDSTSTAQGLTNGVGRTSLRAPGGGEYRMRVLRIGYAPFLSTPVRIGATETVESNIRMTTAVVSLDAVEVQSRSECGGAIGDRSLVGAVWSQIQTALTANVVTNIDRAPAMRVREFRRDISKEGSLRSEVVTSDAIVRGQPYASPDIDVLMSKGYAYLVKDEMTFSAPDANVFTSDEFVTTHCFSAVPGPSDSLVGLSFTPVPRRRQPDVRGTLWVNRSTSELRSIDYSYTNLPVQLRELGLGGQVNFSRLAGGEWVVSYWRIRMPVMAEPPQDYRGKVRSVPHLESYVEIGGWATVAENRSVARALISGVVLDSASGTAVSGATIRIVGVEDSIITDSVGRFRLVTDRGGPQVLMASHPKLGFLDDGSQRDLMISLGDSLKVDFVIPQAAKVAGEFCGPGGSRSGIVGLAAAEAAFAPGLDVRAVWTRNPGAPEEERGQSGPRGLFLFCDLPADVPIKIQLVGKQAESEIRLKPGEYRWVELRAGVVR
jgi:hypothetical protein